MSGWNRARASSRSASSDGMERLQSSRTVRLGRVQPQAPGHRTIYCNNREANSIVKFKGNSVSTTKYNILTFLPKGLFEQFRRVANLYFLMISILSSTPIRVPSKFPGYQANFEKVVSSKWKSQKLERTIPNLA